MVPTAEGEAERIDHDEKMIRRTEEEVDLYGYHRSVGLRVRAPARYVRDWVERHEGKRPFVNHGCVV